MTRSSLSHFSHTCLQVIRPELLRRGFELVKSQNLEVTDDVSIIEAMGLPVRITSGSYTNIKVTTPDDMSVSSSGSCCGVGGRRGKGGIGARAGRRSKGGEGEAGSYTNIKVTAPDDMSMDEPKWPWPSCV